MTPVPNSPSVVWEQHCCLPLSPDADVAELLRYRRPGTEVGSAAGGTATRGACVSVNVGYAPHAAAEVFKLLDAFGGRIAAQPGLTLVGAMADVAAATTRGEVAVIFDLEDSGPLEGDLSRVQAFYDAGVRTMLPSYNHANAAGSGCLDAVDTGLTAFGRDLVREMNTVGMVVDGSHCSVRTGLDLCEVSDRPVIYSHSSMRSVWEHERNITDEQAIACAGTGGVVGITGVGIFLGANDASVEALLRHIDYAVELIGPEHVGVATDYPFDVDDFNNELATNPGLFPESYTRWGPIEFMPPEEFLGIGGALRRRGYPDDAIRAITGGNFARVAAQVWQ